ncbi:hypothetical protein L9F63_016847, partial [Diploptera punctata]
AEMVILTGNLNDLVSRFFSQPMEGAKDNSSRRQNNGLNKDIYELYNELYLVTVINVQRLKYNINIQDLLGDDKL